jgi:anhydro-N-acetylmuramic acid kinase
MSDRSVNDGLFIGMLSGTSRDGVDAVLVNFSGGSMELLHAMCTPYPSAIRQTLDQLLKTGQPPTENLASVLDETLAKFFARVAQNLVRETGMEMSDIQAIGSHGQNVWHQPRGDRPFTMQLGKGELIVRNTGTTVVADFRNADVKAGGEGAPLAPLLHQHLFGSETEKRAILNLGGIANLTLLSVSGNVSGFDCGPGNCLMDCWTNRHLHKDYDNNGSWASKGEADSSLLERLLTDPYFSLPAPKSTGLEYFNMDWLEKALADQDLSPGIVQTTLVELTASSITKSLQDFPALERLLVCGGGAHNAFLMRRIAAGLPGVIVEPTTRYGADPDWVEGMLFAWLAHERLNGHVQDTPPITGASHPVLLGNIYEP